MNVFYCYKVNLLDKELKRISLKSEQQSSLIDKNHETGPFDLIGDIHGCFDELYQLVLKLGYKIHFDQKYTVSHPQKRKLIFVGDLVDRGPKTPEVLRFVMDIVSHGSGFCVIGNHDDKLKRKLQGRDVKITHGLAESLEQLSLETSTFKESIISFIEGLPSHYLFDNCKLAVAHAGLKKEYFGKSFPKVRAYCMYGEVTGKTDELGLPLRGAWQEEYRGETLIVYGHTPISKPAWVNNTINIDTGCVFGGQLTALRYPERELIFVEAAKKYFKSNYLE